MRGREGLTSLFKETVLYNTNPSARRYNWRDNSASRHRRHTQVQF